VLTRDAIHIQPRHDHTHRKPKHKADKSTLGMVANSKYPAEFSFFPFTSPNPNRTRRKNTQDTSAVSKGNHLQQQHIQQSFSGTNVTFVTKTTEASTMSGFDTTFDIPKRKQQHTVVESKQHPKQPLYIDFNRRRSDDTVVKHDESWVTFGVRNDDNTTATSQNELSPLSTKVQLGQADTYESENDKLADQQDDTVTSTTEYYDDDIDFGPLPVVNVNHERGPQPQNLYSDVERVATTTNTAATKTKSHILMLITNMGMNRTQVQNQQRATMMLNALGLTYETVDGSDPDNKEIRNELFRISDTRGSYPQFFVMTEGGDNATAPQISFLGDFEIIEGINDSSGLPLEILEANPTLLTWNRIPDLSKVRA
jgi:hypothetical protein